MFELIFLKLLQEALEPVAFSQNSNQERVPSTTHQTFSSVNQYNGIYILQHKHIF